MPESSPKPKYYRFGAYEVDIVAGELRKHGLQIRLQTQPLEVLTLLLETPGELVTRETLTQRLWADGTIVDFDRGLNAAVTRLRQALSDTAATPVYIETVARRGYRFIAPLNEGKMDTTIEPEDVRQPGPVRAGSGSRTLAVAVLLVALAGASAWFWWPRKQFDNPFNQPLKVTPLTAGPGVERHLSFSPDGTQFAYEWDNGDGRPHVYVKLVGPGDPIRLTPASMSDFGPAWSPDGTQIAFIRLLSGARFGVFVIPALGGVERLITEGPAPPYWQLRQPRRRLAWTADSGHLVVSGPEKLEQGERLFLVAVASGARNWLTQPSAHSSNFGDREPAVSPDGKMLAFVRGESGDSESIYVLPLSNKQRPLGEPRRLDAVRNGRSPAWLPDGRSLIFTPNNPAYNLGSGLLWVGLNSDSAPRPILEAGWGVVLPAVARTGRRFAWGQLNRNLSIWRQKLSVPGEPKSAPENLTPSWDLSYNPQYSPDGKRIAFASSRSGTLQIWTCASDGSQCVQVTDFQGSPITGTPRWSPDGANLAFDSGSTGRGQIYVVSANGGTPRQVTNSTTASVIPSWSRDGQSIYFSRLLPGEPEIWRLPVNGNRAPVRISRGFVAFESVDGRSIFYTRGDRTATLYRSNLDGSGEVPLCEGVVLRGFAPAADRIYFLKEELKGRFAIHEFLLSSGASARVAHLPGELQIGLSISPDGKNLAFTHLDRLTTRLLLAQ